VGVEDDGGFDAVGADGLDEAVGVLLFFDMKRDILGLEWGEKIDEKCVVFDHEVDIEWSGRCAGDGLDDHRADGEVGDEMPIHHIDMHQVASAITDRRDIARKMTEVGREDTGGYLH